MIQSFGACIVGTLQLLFRVLGGWDGGRAAHIPVFDFPVLLGISLSLFVNDLLSEIHQEQALCLLIWFIIKKMIEQ